MLRITITLGLALLVVLYGTAPATTLHVPEEYLTIQDGIDGSVDGDTVLVSDGTYTGEGNRDVDFGGRLIVVMSRNGAEVTILDCEGSPSEPHRGFYFHSGESTSATVKGFLIKGGYAAADWLGDSGGGIYCEDSSPTIEGNIILSNWTDMNGGGIYCGLNSSAEILENRIIGNYADNTGGGIWCGSSSITITGNIISGNTGLWGGGGIFLNDASPVITGTVISHNTAYWGGGLFCWDASPVITTSTITMNLAQTEGGGTYCYYEASPIITNSILWADTPDEVYVDTGTPDVTYSDIDGGWTGEGNIDSDPVFVLADKKDFRLLWESECIDRGDPSLTDPDGTRSDIGAFPFNQDDFLTLYLTPDTTRVNGGDELGVTYTCINRWTQSESFWLLTKVTLPGGASVDIIGPRQFTIPADHTAQVHLSHHVPPAVPPVRFIYESIIGVPPSSLYDTDSFGIIAEP
jgi:hypothetical protein